jgi:hypothetical protein
MLRNLLAERFRLEVHRETRPYRHTRWWWQRTVRSCRSPTRRPRPRTKIPLPAGSQDRKLRMGPDGFPQIPPGAKIPGSFTLPLSRGVSEFLRTKWFARNRHGSDGVARQIRFHVGLGVRSARPFRADPLRSGEEKLGPRLKPKPASVEMLIVDRAKRVPTGN